MSIGVGVGTSPIQRQNEAAANASEVAVDRILAHTLGMTGKATSIYIAYLAGVSQSTVSRALRGSPAVNKETRKRIEEIANKLNYTVDKNASNLRTQHSNTIALLFFEDPTSDDSLINPFFLSMLGSITRACAQRGYDLLTAEHSVPEGWRVACRGAGALPRRHHQYLALGGFSTGTPWLPLPMAELQGSRRMPHPHALKAHAQPLGYWRCATSDALRFLHWADLGALDLNPHPPRP